MYGAWFVENCIGERRMERDWRNRACMIGGKDNVVVGAVELWSYDAAADRPN